MTIQNYFISLKLRERFFMWLFFFIEENWNKKKWFFDIVIIRWMNIPIDFLYDYFSYWRKLKSRK